MKPTNPQPNSEAEYDAWGVDRPSVTEHGPIDDIRSKLVKLECRNWRMEGPGRLHCDTDMGPFSQFIGTDYICLGTGKDGLPILHKLV